MMADNPDLNKEMDAKLEAAKRSTCNPDETRMRRRRAGLPTSEEALFDEASLADKLRIIEGGW